MGNLGITIARDLDGVDSLSMSASQEFEPGSRSSQANQGQKSAKRLELQEMTREALGIARAVGWGGSATG